MLTTGLKLNRFHWCSFCYFLTLYPKSPYRTFFKINFQFFFLTPSVILPPKHTYDCDKEGGGHFSVIMPFYQCENAHYKYKTVSRTSYIYNGNIIPDKTVLIWKQCPAHFRNARLDGNMYQEYVSLTCSYYPLKVLPSSGIFIISGVVFLSPNHLDHYTWGNFETFQFQFQLNISHEFVIQYIYLWYHPFTRTYAYPNLSKSGLISTYG